MACQGLHLYALANHLIATHAEHEEADPTASAAALFALTAKSLGQRVQANARDQLLRRHYSVMDRLREVNERAQAGASRPDDALPSHLIQQATRLKELSRQLSQFGSKGLAAVKSPRTARQLCRIFKLGDAAFADWEAQQRRGKARGGKGRGSPTPSPKKRGKRKTPEKQRAGPSRFGPDSSPAAVAEATGEEKPRQQRRCSSEEEAGALVPKQLFVGNGEEAACPQPAAAQQHSGQQQQHSGQRQQQQQQQQACEEWALFKAFMASPRRPSANGAAMTPPPGAPPAAERPQQAEQQAGQDGEQPMDVDSSHSQHDESAAALTPAALTLPPRCQAKAVAAGAAASPAGRACAAPLGPRQASLVELPAEVTPEKWLPAPGLPAAFGGKENGSSRDWSWEAPTDAGSAADAPLLAAPAAGAARCRPPAVVRRGLLGLQSPATERAAAAREQMAAEAAEVLADDVLRLLSESEADMECGGSRANIEAASCSSASRISSSCKAAGMDAASGSSSSSSSSGSPDAAAPQAIVRRQPRMQPSPAGGVRRRRTLGICAGSRLFEIGAAAAKAAAAVPEVHAGGDLEEHMTRHNLNAAGRVHSIMRPIALPLAGVP